MTIVWCDSTVDVPVIEGVDPVTATEKVPPEANVHISVAVPEPVTLLGVMEHWLMLEVSDTTPVNPLIAMTVIVELPAVFGNVATVVGLANIWKSTTWTKIAAVVCTFDPLVPVTVTV